jgi:hypothetical protein
MPSMRAASRTSSASSSVSGLFGLTTKAIVVAAGSSSCSKPSRFVPSLALYTLTPVKRLPGGRFKPDSVREKIRAAQLINRLQAHIFDGLELSMSQVRAIEILLRRSVPDLQAEATHRYVAKLPEVLTKEEWLAKYGEGQITLQ